MASTDTPGPSDDEVASVKQLVDHWTETAKRSAETRLGFHNQLAVLSAGSIAVIASGTAAALGWSASHPQVHTDPFFITVITASAALWAALFCCIVHNYFETIIRERESSSGGSQTLARIVELTMKRHGSDANVKPLQILKMQQDNDTNITLKIKKAQLWVSTIAVAFFLSGYLALIFLVWTEARLL